ncbi:MAG: GNAT family N-acetyltransferase [Thermodesulfobacteriota bacterium]
MITIRRAAADDRHQLYTLVATIDNFTAEEKELAREVIRDGLASEKNGYHILVAEEGVNSLGGFICYGEIPITKNRWDLYWIAVAPDLSRKGVGSLLLQAMEEKLGSGVRVYVDTSGTSGYARARSFYERNGYTVACVLPDFYRTGDDKVVYCKDI